MHLNDSPLIPTVVGDCYLTGERQNVRYLLIDAHRNAAADPSVPHARDSENLFNNNFMPVEDSLLGRRACPSCQACYGLRLPLATFEETSELRRALTKNADLELSYHAGLPNIDAYGVKNEFCDLLSRFMDTRFPSKDPGSRPFNAYKRLKDYTGYAGLTLDHIVARDPATKKLMGCMLFQTAENAVFGTMFFYEPSMASRSMGHYLIMSAIRYIQGRGNTHLYLGDWTNRPSAYSWKDKYGPCEVYKDGQWILKSRAEMRLLRTNPKQAYPAPGLTR